MFRNKDLFSNNVSNTRPIPLNLPALLHLMFLYAFARAFGVLKNFC